MGYGGIVIIFSPPIGRNLGPPALDDAPPAYTMGRLASPWLAPRAESDRRGLRVNG